MTNKTEMNEMQKQFINFINENYNENYNHIYWMFYEEDENYDFWEWYEEVKEEFCNEYNYKWNDIKDKIYENFNTKYE